MAKRSTVFRVSVQGRQPDPGADPDIITDATAPSGWDAPMAKGRHLVGQPYRDERCASITSAGHA